MSTEIAHSDDDSDAVTLAAVDLGSNSFHMVVMRQSRAGLQVVDRVREPVRLASGLRPDKTLDEETQQRALETLSRFSQILRGIPISRSRVVGTNTLRRMKKAGPFLRAAEKALGRPVEIISGVEEARLIFTGVVHGMRPNKRRLVVDIGGGSTEIIIGCGDKPQLMESVHMGCVTYTQRYFPGGKITPARLQRARRAAAADVDFLVTAYRDLGWDRALGSSGSARSVWRVAEELGHGSNHISKEGIDAVGEALADLGKVRSIKFDGLREDRRAVFVGSWAVLAGVFDALGVTQMEVSDRALREGVIYDLLGRNSEGDVREQSVRNISSRFTIDTEQSRRVTHVARRLYDCVAKAWDLVEETDWPYLRWACALHELGLAISHSGFHKHGAYVIAKADMHGFSRRDQTILSALIRVHRGRFRRELLTSLPAPLSERGERLAILLRIAVVLCRSRHDLTNSDQLKFRAEGKGLRLQLPAAWLGQHPLTVADVETETTRLEEHGWKLQLG